MPLGIPSDAVLDGEGAGVSSAGSEGDGLTTGVGSLLPPPQPAATSASRSATATTAGRRVEYFSLIIDSCPRRGSFRNTRVASMIPETMPHRHARRRHEQEQLCVLARDEEYSGVATRLGVECVDSAEAPFILFRSYAVTIQVGFSAGKMGLPAKTERRHSNNAIPCF